MYQETYLEIAIKCFLMYPIWCIGAGFMLYFVLKVYTDKKGKTTVKELGDNLTQFEAAKKVAESSNNYELKGSQYWQEGTDEDGKYVQFGGETPNGGIISWVIQGFKVKKDIKK